jgi:hypothetical protein
MKAFLKKYIVEIGVLFLLALPPVKWLWGGYIVFGHDASFYLNHWENFISLFYAWNPIQNLGMNWPFMRGYIPMVALEELFLRLTGSFSVMQMCIGVFWFFGMMLSMYVLVRSVFPEKKYWVMRLLSSVLYGYNFFILHAWVIFERPKFSAYILLPLTLAVVHNLYVKKITFLRGFILFWVISFFFNAGGLPPLLGTTLLAIAFSILWYWVVQMRREGKQSFWWGIKVGFLFIAGYILANVYWIVPFVFFTFGNYASYVGSVGSVDGTIAWEKMVSANASFVNLFRLQGNPEWVNTVGHPYAGMYIQNPLLIFLSIGVFAAIFIGWVIGKNRSESNKSIDGIRMLMALLSVAGLFMMAGTHAPFGKFYELAMRYIPGFAIFRSSFYKFAPITFLSVSWLFGYSMQCILDGFHWKKGREKVIGGLLILGLVCYFFPYWTKNIFQFQPDYTTRVKVPDYALQMKLYIDTNTNAHSRILVMPKLDEGFIGAPLDTSTWGFYCLGPFAALSTNRTIMYNGLGGNDVISSLYDQFEKANDESFLKIVRILGITHILYRIDVRLSASFETSTPLSFWESAIRQKTYLKKKYTAGAWSLYEINDPSISPMVFSADRIATGNLQTGHMVDFLGNTAGYALAIGQQTLPEAVVQEQIFEAECMYCRENELTTFIDGIDISAYGKSSIITKYFQGRKEEAQFNALRDLDPRKIDMYIVFANRALVHNRLEEWSSDMLAAEKIISWLQGKNKYEYAIRFYAFIEAQRKYVNGGQEMNIDQIMPYVWVTDRTNKSVKYILDVRNDIKGAFTVAISNNQNNFDWEMDGHPVKQDEQIIVSKGAHLVEGKFTSVSLPDIPRVYIQVKNTVTQTLHAPRLSWNQESPVSFTIHIQDAGGPYILGVNQSFDAGWKVVRKDRPLTQTADHFELNGMVNGWYIRDTGTYDISVYYEPQKYVNWGMAIFVLGLLCISYIGIKRISKYNT